ncbi:MAG: hypothetical protein CMH52_00910 [Myxococcales bacterium]|nr:hypothetical protein [Myxococcales bacterium]
MTYLIITALAIMSPVLAIAEPIAVIAGLSTKVEWWLVALCLASGQTIGFTLMYFFGEFFLAKWTWLAQKLRRVNVEEYAHKRQLFTSFASLFGMPPLTALALAGPLYEPRFSGFISLVFTCRFARFLVFAGAATALMGYVDPSIIPKWLTPYL